MSEADAEIGGGLPLGEYLKSVRESKGLQLEQASQVTKISKSYLVALEQGEYDKLPNPAYIKGFLRLYASYLGLSGDEVVKSYESTLPARPKVQAEPRAERSDMEMMERAKAGKRGRWAIPLLLLGLVILAAVFLTDSGEEQPPPAPQAPPAPQSAQAPAAPVAPAATPVLPQRTSAAPATGAAPADVAIPPLTAPAGENQEGVVLRLRFNQDSWLSITIDDVISQRYDLKAGDVIEWKGARLFVVDVGDGGAVEAEFNGRVLKTLGEPGKPAHVELKGR